VKRETAPEDPHETKSVDVVVPVYGERGDALDATLAACATQSYPVTRMFIVDDGSPKPIVLPQWAADTKAKTKSDAPEIVLLRLAENQGISAARNAAIAQSQAELIACINVEVLPASDWLQTCVAYLASADKVKVGVVYTRTLPQRPERLLTRWRMRFQEPAHAESSGPAEFAHGHAVLFRKSALDAVNGYDARFRRHHEDSDICQRMAAVGWATHYIAESRCISIQADSLQELAKKQLRDSGWYSPQESSLLHLYASLTKWTAVRAARNLITGRWYFLPLDLAIWWCALWKASLATLRAALRIATRS
jgi:cellulose synthase/poly-beta-1,6-N-acetylglucosamine synthase-like glycosyltransferase